MSDNFRAKDIALKAQKKVLSRMSMSVAKVFVDDKMSSLLDNVYRLCKTYVTKISSIQLCILSCTCFKKILFSILDPKQEGG